MSFSCGGFRSVLKKPSCLIAPFLFCPFFFFSFVYLQNCVEEIEVQKDPERSVVCKLCLPRSPFCFHAAAPRAGDVNLHRQSLLFPNPCRKETISQGSAPAPCLSPGALNIPGPSAKPRAAPSCRKKGLRDPHSCPYCSGPKVSGVFYHEGREGGGVQP